MDDYKCLESAHVTFENRETMLNLPGETWETNLSERKALIVMEDNNAGQDNDVKEEVNKESSNPQTLVSGLRRSHHLEQPQCRRYWDTSLRDSNDSDGNIYRH